MEKVIVVQGAICKCQFGNAPDKIKVLSHQKEYANDSSGSDKSIVTTKEIGSATLEKNCFGTCPKLGSPPPPCKPVITEWKDYYEEVQLSNGGYIILEDSKAVCAVAGTPCIEIVHHGQIAEPCQQNFENADEDVQQQLNPMVNPQDMILPKNIKSKIEIPNNKTFATVNDKNDSPKEIVEGSEFTLKMRKLSDPSGNLISEDFHNLTSTPVDVDVCGECEYALFDKNKEVKFDSVEWSVKIEEQGKEAEHPLDKLKEEKIITYPHKLSGANIFFRIPYQFGQKTITIIAKFRNEQYEDVLLEGKISVIDHIIAAFYRIDADKEHEFELKGITDVKNSWNAFRIRSVAPPLYHIQGMYRYNENFYFTGSVRAGTWSYAMKISGIEDLAKVGQAKHDNTYIFAKGALSFFDHPGGIQVADNILAVGFEKYDELGLTTTGGSVVAFFDAKDGGMDPQIAKNYNGKNYSKKDSTGKESDLNNEIKELRILQDVKYIDKYNPDLDEVYDSEGEKVEKLWHRYKGGKDPQAYEITNKYKRDLRTVIKRNLDNSDDQPVTDQDLYPSLGIYDEIYRSQADALEGDRENKMLKGIPSETNERASATGIVKITDNYYLVAVRGFNNAILFFKIVNNKTRIIPLGSPIINVGDFQNINLYMDEKGDIYLFGMGDEDVPNVCRMYKVIINENAEPEKVNLQAVYIDSTGCLKYENYAADKNNKRVFLRSGAKEDPGFFWSSCVYIYEEGKAKPAQTEKGFKKKIAIYMSDSIIRKNKIKCKYLEEPKFLLKE